MIYPKSFLTLLLLGFALAMLPLLFAFGNAAVYVDRLAEQSRSTVAQAVQATRASRVLVEQLTLMERSARQYAVLEDEQLLDNFKAAHNTFISNLKLLGRLPLSQQQMAALASLGGQELSLFAAINRPKTVIQSPPEKTSKTIALASAPLGLPPALLEQFNDLSQQAQGILAENNRLIDRESAALAETAERTQRLLFWQSLTLLPVGLVVALLITYLVARPIRQMDEAIKHLGEGHYADTVSIEGPIDIRVLGERLDWLRGQLQAVEQEKQRFLLHVSHELKTPLTSIRQGSELLSDEVGGSLSAQQQEIVAILRDNSLRLQTMIENLLNYTAAQFKQTALNVSKVWLDESMRNLISGYRMLLDSKQITLKTDLHAVHLMGDEEKIHTVMDNLLSNAIKYTPKQGNIELRIYSEAEHAVIEVYDSGPGVGSSDKAKVFNPFYRGVAVYESLVSGSGLGLSIAKEHVEAHEGSIALLPSPVGARFQVRLPYARSQLQDHAHAKMQA